MIYWPGKLNKNNAKEEDKKLNIKRIRTPVNPVIVCRWEKRERRGRSEYNGHSRENVGSRRYGEEDQKNNLHSK